MKEIANSSLLMVLIIIGLVYIIGLSLAFLKKTYTRCLEFGISKEKLHDVIKSSAVFSVVPAISIVVGFFALVAVFQSVIWPWWRLSVIGSLSYETQISGLLASSFGETMDNLSKTQFGAVMILMSIGVLSGFLILIPFGKKMCMSVTKDENASTIGILMIYIPVGFSEALSYIPVLGSSSYLGFITGNIMNLKFPCAVNGMKVADVEQNTPEGDAIATVSIAVSSIVAVVILAAAALLSSVIRPIFETPAMNTAKDYVIPALFGSMALGLFANSSNSGKVVKGAIKGVIPVLVIVSVVSLLARMVGAGSSLLGLVGILIVCMLPIGILSSYIMWKKGIIKVVDVEETK